MSTHVYREPFPCDEGCEHLSKPCPGNHAVVVTWHNASAITSIHIEPGSKRNGLWLDTGGVAALRMALAREAGDDPRDARIAELEQACRNALEQVESWQRVFGQLGDARDTIVAQRDAALREVARLEALIRSTAGDLMYEADAIHAKAGSRMSDPREKE